jgi:hypothetical protein
MLDWSPLLAWGQPCGGGREKIGLSGELEWLILEERVGKRAKRIYGLMQYRVDEAICERAKVYRVETVSVAVRAGAFESESSSAESGVVGYRSTLFYLACAAGS